VNSYLPPSRKLSVKMGKCPGFTEFKALATPLRLRVQLDGEGFPFIPGRLGRIEWTGGPMLAVYSDRPKVFAKLLVVPGIKRHQIGDKEIRLLFEPALLAEVAAVIQARKRRTLTPEDARQRGLKAAHRATSGVQDRRGASKTASDMVAA
jgi:hypothetical protein